MVAAVLIGLEEYHVWEKEVFDQANKLLFSIFFMEFALKVVAEGLFPYRYFTDRIEGKWNCFDFGLLVLMAAQQVDPNMARVTSLRLLRLLRIAHHSPKLREILQGTAEGIASLMYLLCLAFLVSIKFTRANSARCMQIVGFAANYIRWVCRSISSGRSWDSINSRPQTHTTSAPSEAR